MMPYILSVLLILDCLQHILTKKFQIIMPFLHCVTHSVISFKRSDVLLKRCNNFKKLSCLHIIPMAGLPLFVGAFCFDACCDK